MEEAGRGRLLQRRGVAVRCLGCQKARHSPLVIRHDSLLFTLLLGVLEGGRVLELDAKGRTGLPTDRYDRSSKQTALSIPELPGTDRAGFSLLLCHLHFPSDLNGGGADNDGRCIIQG